jgi:hypothetical protein
MCSIFALLQPNNAPMDKTGCFLDFLVLPNFLAAFKAAGAESFYMYTTSSSSGSNFQWRERILVFSWRSQGHDGMLLFFVV